MPIGVPKVAFRLPGDSVSQWVDLYNRLYRERVLFLAADLDDELANQLVGIMIYLSNEDSSRELYLYINSPGGPITSGLAVFDVIQHVDAKVHTICVGLAASMASFVLSGGTSGLRLGFPNSRVMIHQPLGGGRGQATDVFRETLELIRLRKQIGRIYCRITGNALATISSDLDRDFYLSAIEAKNYGSFGLIDQIAKDSDPVTLADVWNSDIFQEKSFTGG
jgi:ATP-dependent Clp protease protease subunit